MSAPTSITIDLNLDQYLVRFNGYNNDGEPMESPQTLEEIVLERAAALVAQSAINSGTKDAYRTLADRVTRLRDEMLRARLGPMVDEALTVAIQPTNTYGETKGEPVTLREVIVKEATAYLTKPVDNYSRDKGNVVEATIRSEVAKAVKAELDAAIKDAVAQVRAAVTSQAAALITESVSRAAGLRS